MDPQYRSALAMLCALFFFNDPATTEIYTLSLHDALPILAANSLARSRAISTTRSPTRRRSRAGAGRSEEHTSELQSHVNLVCRLLLEKKKSITPRGYRNGSLADR